LIRIRLDQTCGRRREMDRQNQRIGVRRQTETSVATPPPAFPSQSTLGDPVRLAALDHVVHHVASNDRALPREKMLTQQWQGECPASASR